MKQIPHSFSSIAASLVAGAYFLFLAPPLARAQAAKPALPKTLGQPRTFFGEVGKGAPPFEDRCRRQLDGASDVHICLRGNGKYDLALIDAFAKVPWFQDHPLAVQAVGEVVFRCEDGEGKLNAYPSVILPLASEVAKTGKKARIELPCKMTDPAAVSQAMNTAVEILASSLNKDLRSRIAQGATPRFPALPKDPENTGSRAQLDPVLALSGTEKASWG